MFDDVWWWCSLFNYGCTLCTLVSATKQSCRYTKQTNDTKQSAHFIHKCFQVSSGNNMHEWVRLHSLSAKYFSYILFCSESIYTHGHIVFMFSLSFVSVPPVALYVYCMSCITGAFVSKSMMCDTDINFPIINGYRGCYIVRYLVPCPM